MNGKRKGFGMVKEMMSWIGKTGMVGSDGIFYQVKIADVKVAWGKMLFQVEPVAGSGSKWIESTSITFNGGSI